MAELLSALSDLWLAAALRGTRSAYALVNAGHILSLAMLVGAIVTFDLRVLGVFRSTPIVHLIRPLTRVAGFGLLFALLTGFLLFIARPDHYAANSAFQIKLVIVAVGILNALIVRALPPWRRVLQGEPVTAVLRTTAAISLTAWVAAVLAGRWIAFV